MLIKVRLENMSIKKGKKAPDKILHNTYVDYMYKMISIQL